MSSVITKSMMLTKLKLKLKLKLLRTATNSPELSPIVAKSLQIVLKQLLESLSKVLDDTMTINKAK